MSTNSLVRLRLFSVAVVAFIGFAALPARTQEPAKPKYSVKIADDKTIVVDIEDSGAIDPTQRINFGGKEFGNGFYMNIRTINNQTLHLSHFPTFQINGQSIMANAGVVAKANPLPKGPGGRARVGYTSTQTINGVRITQTLELHPSKTKAPGQKRLLNNVLITHTIENPTAANVRFGLRIYMDTYVISNDGCLFAAPTTHPGKVLDALVLEGKTLPPYLQMLQMPNLANPGFVSHLTLNVGSKFEKANKLILTQHGAGFNTYDMPARASMGDSAIGLYWEIKDIKPGGKRELAYVYGEGVAVPAESEGRFQTSLGGSFEPGKTFTVSALVADPALGQTLSLELPAGMKRLEGKEVQPVASLSQDNEYSAVLWKCRVTEPGQHTLRIRSSTGVTQTKIVTVTADK